MLFTSCFARNRRFQSSHVKDNLHFTTDFAEDATALRTYVRATDRFLTIEYGAGTYTYNNVEICDSYPGVHIFGQGVGITTIDNADMFDSKSIYGDDGDGNSYGSSSVGPGGPTLPRIETVSAGSRTVTLLDPVRHAHWFYPGAWVILMGYCLQNFGAPQNNAFHEYHEVLSIDQDTGVITFTAPLRYGYKSTWPETNYGSSLAPDQAGSATCAVMHRDWNMANICEDMSVTFPAQFGNTDGRSQIWRDMEFLNYNPGFTVNDYLLFENCTLGPGTLEWDKLIDYCEFVNCDVPCFNQIQSSSINQIRWEGCTFTNEVQGTPAAIEMVDCDFAEYTIFGPTAYGAPLGPTILDNVYIPEGMGPDSISSNRLIGTSIITDVTAGVMTIPEDDLGNWGLMAIPGGWYVHQLSNNPQPPMIRVTDVAQSGTDYLYTTNLPDPCVTFDASTRMTPHVCPYLTVTNTDDGYFKMQSFPAAEGRPMGSYWKITSTETEHYFLNDSPTYTTAIPEFQCFGYPQEIRINVTRAYGGAAGTMRLAPISQLDTNFAAALMVAPDGTQSEYRPYVNLKVTGERVITAGSVVGAQSGDSLTAWTAGDWISKCGRACGISSNISSLDPALLPEFTIEVTLKHGIHSLDCNYLGTISSETDSTTFTFHDVNFGCVPFIGWTRKIAMAVHWPSTTLSSATIGGVAATIEVQAGGVSRSVAIITADVPTGTEGDVVLTFSGSTSRVLCGVYAIRQATSVDATASDTSITGGVEDVSLTVPGDIGVVITACTTDGNPEDITWVGVDQMYDTTLEQADFAVSGGMAKDLDPGALTIQATTIAGSNARTVAYSIGGDVF
jgi:hypothetical protein